MMASGAPLSSPQYLQRWSNRQSWAFHSCCDGTVRDNRHKLKLRRFRPDVKNFFSLLGQPNNVTDWQKRLQCLHPWRLPRPTWINPEHLGLVSCLTLLWARGGWTSNLLCPFQPGLPHDSLWVAVLRSQGGASGRYEGALRKEQNVSPIIFALRWRFWVSKIFHFWILKILKSMGQKEILLSPRKSSRCFWLTC